MSKPITARFFVLGFLSGLISVLSIAGTSHAAPKASSKAGSCGEKLRAGVSHEAVIRNIDGTCSIVQPRFLIYGAETLLAINSDIHVICELAGFGERSGVDVRDVSVPLKDAVTVAFIARGDARLGTRLTIQPEESKSYVRTLTCR